MFFAEEIDCLHEKPRRRRASGGSSGGINIGSQTSRGAIKIGDNRSIGDVDLAAMDGLEAYVDQLLIGVTNGRRAEGTSQLPQTSLIDARSIVVGSDATHPTSNAQDGATKGTLTLGRETTILADEFVIGRDYGSVIVRAPAGSHVQLGAADRRVELQMGTGITDTNRTYSGNFDLTGAVVTAWLGEAVLGDKNMRPGEAQAELLFSSDPENVIDAERIFIGGNQSLGRLRFAGGVLRADSIQRGSGEAIFEWTGGTLEVGEFGLLGAPFDLNNPGGVLAPGASIGQANVVGSYTQGIDATLAIEVGGAMLGFDHDRLVIDGAATLEGTLLVASVDENPFAPEIGQSFEIVTASQGIQGAFSALQLPDLPAGRGWRLDYLPGAVTLNIVEAMLQLQADFDDNGTVNGDDLRIWESAFGQSDLGDADGDGDSDGSDLLRWQREFGLSNATISAVPEPRAIGQVCTALVCAILLTCLLVQSRRARKSKCFLLPSPQPTSRRQAMEPRTALEAARRGR